MKKTKSTWDRLQVLETTNKLKSSDYLSRINHSINCKWITKILRNHKLLPIHHMRNFFSQWHSWMNFNWIVVRFQFQSSLIVGNVLLCSDKPESTNRFEEWTSITLLTLSSFKLQFKNFQRSGFCGKKYNARNPNNTVRLSGNLNDFQEIETDIMSPNSDSPL